MTIADYYVWCYEQDKNRRNLLTNSYKELERCYKIYIREHTPNNKLKMQGKPMRRKG